MGSFGFILLAILGISLLVVVHETGHYLAARAFGMRVERYSIGLGPTLFKYQPKGSPTVFQVCAIPVLAYVQVAGMNPFEEHDAKDPDLYCNKGVFARIVVILGGPFANYLFASLLVFGLVLASPNGYPIRFVDPVTIGAVTEDSPAETSGMLPGDAILQANGEAVDNFGDLLRITSGRKDQPTDYVIERSGERMTVSVTPAAAPDAAAGDAHGRIGILAATEPWYHGFSGAIEGAFVVPFVLTTEQLTELGKKISHLNADGLTGPVGMVQKTAEQAEQGPLAMMHILMLISVALGLFNLLPFPALDGGRFVFLAYEVITRRKPNERFEAIVHTVGIVFLLGVIAMVTYNEIVG